MNSIYKEGKGFSVYEDSIDIKGLLKTTNIKLSEISKVESIDLLKTLKITTKDGKKYSTNFKLKEFFESTKEFLQGKKDLENYKKEIKEYNENIETIKAKDKKKKIWIVLSIIFFIILIAGLSDTKPEPKNDIQVVDKVQKVDKTEAWTMSKQFVERFLKSPSTADFPWVDYTSVKTGDRYKISSYVDSQNGFGAMIRSKWTAILKYEGGDWADINNWELISLIMDGKTIYKNQK